MPEPVAPRQSRQEETTPFEKPQAENFNPNEDMAGPSDADMAEMFGGGAPEKDEDVVPSGGGELPDLEKVKDMIPEKTHVLMQELFRAKLSKVQRVNPKKIQ